MVRAGTRAGPAEDPVRTRVEASSSSPSTTSVPGGTDPHTPRPRPGPSEGTPEIGTVVTDFLRPGPSPSGSLGEGVRESGSGPSSLDSDSVSGSVSGGGDSVSDLHPGGRDFDRRSGRGSCHGTLVGDSPGWSTAPSLPYNTLGRTPRTPTIHLPPHRPPATTGAPSSRTLSDHSLSPRSLKHPSVHPPAPWSSSRSSPNP